MINDFYTRNAMGGAYFQSTASTTAALYKPKHPSTGYPIAVGVGLGLGLWSELELPPSRPRPCEVKPVYLPMLQQ